MLLPAGNRFLPVEGVTTTVKHNKWLVICASTICLFLYGLPALAHHGNAAYDLDNPITLKGTVTEFVWSNPHVQIYFDVKNRRRLGRALGERNRQPGNAIEAWMD